MLDGLRGVRDKGIRSTKMSNKLTNTSVVALLQVAGLLILATSTTRAGGVDNERQALVTSHHNPVEIVQKPDDIAPEDWGKEIAKWSEIIAQNPKDSVAYEYRGCCYFAKGSLDKAISDFTQAIQLDGNNAKTYLNRGNAHRAKNEFEKAIMDFNLAIAIDAKYAEAYLSRGSTYQAKLEADKAIEDMSKCLQFDPTNATAYKVRASLYSQKGSFDKGISDFSEVLRMNPGDSDALTERGWTYFRMGRFAAAAQDYSEAIRVAPNNPKAYNDLGWLQATCPDVVMRNGKEAVGSATKACELTHWNDWKYIDTLAAACAEAGDFKKAIEYQKQAIDMNEEKGDDRDEMQARLSLFEQQQPYRGKQ